MEVTVKMKIKLDSMQETLNNRIDNLTEALNNLTSKSNHNEEMDIQNVSVISTELPDQELPTRPYSKHNVTVESIASMTANIMMEEK